MTSALSTHIMRKTSPYKLRKLAARLGLEPRQNESESFVLPLHHQAVDFIKLMWVSGDPAAQLQTLRARSGAGDGIRTRNRLFTKQVLYH